MNFNILIFWTFLNFQNSYNKKIYILSKFHRLFPILRQHRSSSLLRTSRALALKTYRHNDYNTLNFNMVSLKNFNTAFSSLYVNDLEIYYFVAPHFGVATHQHLPCVTIIHRDVFLLLLAYRVWAQKLCSNV